MRPCSSCLSFGVSCRVNRQYLKYEECYRKNRKCKLAPDYKGIDEAIAKAEKLDEEIIDLMRKTARKRTKRKYWLRRLRDLGDTESRNILEIEAEESLEDQLEAPVTGPTSSVAISEDPALLAISPNAFDDFLRDLSSGVGETAPVSSGSSQGAL